MLWVSIGALIFCNAVYSSLVYYIVSKGKYYLLSNYNKNAKYDEKILNKYMFCSNIPIVVATITGSLLSLIIYTIFACLKIDKIAISISIIMCIFLFGGFFVAEYFDYQMGKYMREINKKYLI